MKKIECRLCKSKKLYQFLDLGYHPHSDQFRDNIDEPEVQYPLRLNQCEDCGFVQLSHVVDGKEMYQKDYLYESSITKTADAHWTNFAKTVCEKLGITSGKYLDIGGNDGTLALKFKEQGMDVTNIDPCFEVGDISRNRGVNTLSDFFKDEVVEGGNYDLITGANVFAHVDNLDIFMKGIDMNLSEHGVFVFESPYLGDFISGLEYDTVYHQHLSYLSLKPLIKFLAKHGFEVFDVERHPLHGGGFRCFIARKGICTVEPSVKELADSESFDELTMKSFGLKSEAHAKALYEYVSDLYGQRKKIVCFSAPAKGMTLLNYTGIGRFISGISEKSSLKIGRYTPGTHIRIVPDSSIIETQPDYAVILAWNFADEIIKNNPNYKGKWIIPLPIIEVR
jgi:SAM-dependent methyltransferase